MIAPVDLPDLEAERNDEDQDGAEREEQATPPARQLGAAGLPDAIDGGDDLHPVSQNWRDAGRIEAVHLGPRERQLAARLAERELLIADFDAGVLEAAEQRIRAVDLVFEAFHPAAQGARGSRAFVRFVVAAVARLADARRRGAEHLIRRLQHGVVGVALDAALVEDRLMDAGRELLRKDRVT